MANNHSINNTSSKKSFFERLNQLFQSEPKNRTDLVEVIRDSQEKDVIDPYTRDMLEGVINISNEKVRDIMIPRFKIVNLKKNQTLDECLKIIIHSTHSRFPVINENKDHIEGLLMAKDLLKFMYKNTEKFTIKKILRPAVIIPESKRVDLLLKEFRLKRYHMAIVVNEFGGVSGLITIEDILELIVGKIKDEYDNEDELNIRQLSKHVYRVKSITQIDDFNKIFKTNFKNKEVDTIGGLIMQTLGYLPVCGEIIKIKNYIFKITMANSRKIIQIQVKIPKKNQSNFLKETKKIS